VDARDAVALIADAVPRGKGAVWADFGAGDGTFTRALVEILGSDSRVYAVDRDASALESIDRWRGAMRNQVTPVVADLARPFTLPSVRDAALDGALIANTLHFMRDANAVLARLVQPVKPGGRVVIIEYDRRGPNRWVPYPIPAEALPEIAATAGLSAPVITARRASEYGGDIYVAAADRLAVAE
jgi:ubiquinone/menaquinone biosynthesis C-methylase UbiE